MVFFYHSEKQVIQQDSCLSVNRVLTPAVYAAILPGSACCLVAKWFCGQWSLKVSTLWKRFC